MKNMVTTHFLAKHYGVSRQAVCKWRSRKDFPFVKYSERIFFYDLNEVEQYFKNKAKKQGE